MILCLPRPFPVQPSSAGDQSALFTAPVTALGDAEVVSRQRMSLLAVSFIDLPVTAIAHCVKTVLAACTPRQVSQMIIRWYVVGMTGHHAWRTWANKRFKYQRVDCAVKASFKNDMQVLASPHSPWFQNPSGSALQVWLPGPRNSCDYSIKRADQSSITGFVATFESWDCPPSHRHDDISGGVD